MSSWILVGSLTTEPKQELLLDYSFIHLLFSSFTVLIYHNFLVNLFDNMIFFFDLPGYNISFMRLGSSLSFFVAIYARSSIGLTHSLWSIKV